MNDLLEEAIKKGDLDKTRILVSSEFNILEKDEHGNTPLHLASHYTYTKIVRYEHGWIGSYESNLEIVKFLIEFGFDVSEKNNYGSTALHLACNYCRFDIVKFLVESGSDIEAVDNYGKTAINVAGTEKIKDFLVEQLEIQQNMYLLK